MEEKKTKKITPMFVNGMYVFMLLFYLCGSMGLGIVLGVLRKSNPDFALGIIPSLLLSQAMIWVGLLLAFLVGRRVSFYKDDFKFKSSVGKTVATFALVPIYTGCIMPTMWLLNIVTMFFAKNQIAEATSDMTVYPLIVQLIVIALVPAVSEELVCRGAIFGGLKRTGIIGAIIISALYFGVLHLNINQFAYATALGIGFCILNEATGFIYSSMLGHFIVNGTSVVLSYLMTVLANNEELMGEATQAAQNAGNPIMEMAPAMKIMVVVVYGVLAIGGLILATLLIWAISAINGRTAHVKAIFKKGSANPYAESEEKKPQFNVFFWIAIVLGFGYMIITEFVL